MYTYIRYIRTKTNRWYVLTIYHMLLTCGLCITCPTSCTISRDLLTVFAYVRNPPPVVEHLSPKEQVNMLLAYSNQMNRLL